MKKVNFKKVLFHQISNEPWLKEFWLSAVSTFIGTGILNIFFKSFEKSLIAGLMIGLYALIYSLYSTFKKESQEALKISKELSEKCIQLMNIHNAFLYDEWLYDHINKVHDIHINVKTNRMHLKLVIEEINKGIDSAELYMKGKRIDYGGLNGENKRQKRLKDIVSHSDQYVKAVTAYDPLYWEEFWNNKNGFSENYRKANIEAAERGVIIERIFILPRAIINGEDNDKSESIKKTAKLMIGKNQNLKIYFLPEDIVDKISPEVSNYKNVHFLICDDKFVGLARSFSSQSQTESFISIAIKSDIEEMKDVFNDLLVEAIDASSSALLRNDAEK
jgi:hypothetical protein